MDRESFSQQSGRARSALVLSCAFILLHLGACGGPNGSEDGGGSSPRVRTARTLASSALETTEAGAACTGTNPHVKHVNMGLDCSTCHPCGGVVGIATITVGSRSTEGATIQPSTETTPASCLVACHYPPGETPTPVTWTAQTIECANCHGTPVPAGVEVRSFHPGLGSAGSIACANCHDTSQHMSGTVRFVGGQGNVDDICAGCHSGTGATLSGETPPLLVGWTELEGDFHGSRAGTGYGGTLLSPWVRGQPPLSCTDCHDAHASGNSFLLAQTVNGHALPQAPTGGPAAIDRAGVGGHELCESCHAGARHGTCAGCHVTDPKPAGAACFSCHGHEGIRIFVEPSGTPEAYHGASGNCDHCHGSWMVTTDYVPPAITYGGRVLVTDVTTSGARISWDTDEPATSYVEYGTVERGLVAGSQLLTTAHEVVLSGLAPSTAYQFRVRSSDPSRNVTRSSVLSLSTTCATCLAPPTLTPIAPVWTYDDSFSKALAWSAVTAPDGDPVQYRVVLAIDDASFAAPDFDSGWMAAQTYPVTLPTAHTYYWRVKARDAVHLTESEWSATSSFWSAYNEVGY